MNVYPVSACTPSDQMLRDRHIDCPSLWPIEGNVTPRHHCAFITLFNHVNSLKSITINSKTYKRMDSDSDTYAVYKQTGSLSKAKQIISAFRSCIYPDPGTPAIFDDEASMLLKVLRKQAVFIGKNTSYIEKIFTQTLDKHTTINPKRKIAIQKFLKLFYAKIRDSSDPTNGTDEIVIGTSSAGGAHKTIARIVGSFFTQQGIKFRTIDETALYGVDDDPLKLFVGLSYSQCYSKVNQQMGSPAYSRSLKNLSTLLGEFIPTPHHDNIVAKVGTAKYFFSTSHHAYNVRLLSERVQKICFQICDFGEIPDKFVLKKHQGFILSALKYKLPNIQFLAPSDSTYVHLKDGQKISMSSSHMGSNRDLQNVLSNMIVEGGYPVNSACYEDDKKVSDACKKYFTPLGFRPNTKKIIMVMGQQGVAGILDVYLNIIQSQYEKMKVDEDWDVMTVCGNNHQLLKKMTTSFIQKNKQTSQLLEVQLDGRTHKITVNHTNISQGLNLIFTSAIPNTLLVHLGKDSDAYLTKPGGATVAEGIYGNFPMLLHKNASSSWEFGNIEEAKNRVDAIELHDFVDGKEAINQEQEEKLFSQIKEMVGKEKILSKSENGRVNGLLTNSTVDLLLKFFGMPTTTS